MRPSTWKAALPASSKQSRAPTGYFTGNRIGSRIKRDKRRAAIKELYTDDCVLYVGIPPNLNSVPG